MDISKNEISQLPTIVGPTGIGDLSWMYSKLMYAGPMNWQVVGGWPPRSREFLQMLPMVRTAEYAQELVYSDILTFQQLQGWDQPGITWGEIAGCGFGRNLLEVNKHLEAGKRLEDWLPDLPCNFHYDINISIEAIYKAQQKLQHLDRPICLVNCASDRGAEAWKTWKVPEWLEFLNLLKRDLEGGSIALIGGFWDDLTSDVAQEGGYADLVGRTPIDVVMAMLQQADYYIGFSSGLGIMRTVMARPAFMMWPDHQVLLSTSWAPPEMLEAGTYAMSPWKEPRVVYERVHKWVSDVRAG